MKTDLRLIPRLEKLPRSVSIAAGVVLIAAIGFLDYITAFELSFSGFYLLPIFVLS